MDEDEKVFLERIARFEEDNTYEEIEEQFLDLGSNTMLFEAPDSEWAEETEMSAYVWGKNRFKAWNNNLTPNEKSTFLAYTGAPKANYYLRKFKGELVTGQLENSSETWKEYKEYNSMIKILDGALNRSIVEEDMYVFRRVDESQFFSKEILSKNNDLKLRGPNNKIKMDVAKKINQEFMKKEFIDYSYVSTSLSRDPIDLIQRAALEDKPVLLQIRIPKGRKAAFLVNGVTFFPEQNEVLIPRNSKFKYIRMGKDVNFRLSKKTNTKTYYESLVVLVELASN